MEPAARYLQCLQCHQTFWHGSTNKDMLDFSNQVHSPGQISLKNKRTKAFNKKFGILKSPFPVITSAIYKLIAPSDMIIATHKQVVRHNWHKRHPTAFTANPEDIETLWTSMNPEETLWTSMNPEETLWPPFLPVCSLRGSRK